MCLAQKHNPVTPMRLKPATTRSRVKHSPTEPLSLIADPGVKSSIPARAHTFVEIDHEIISTVILLPSTESFKKGFVSYKRKYVDEVLVNRLFKLAPEKVWSGELTVSSLP